MSLAREHFIYEYFTFARILQFQRFFKCAFYLWVFFIYARVLHHHSFIWLHYTCQSFTSQVSCITTVHLPKCCIFGESCMITLYLPEYITFSIFHLCRCLVSTERTIVVRRWDSKHAWLKTFLVWGDISSREVTMCLCVWYLCDRLRWMRGSL